jgi:hypothetical protein
VRGRRRDPLGDRARPDRRRLVLTASR